MRGIVLAKDAREQGFPAEGARGAEKAEEYRLLYLHDDYASEQRFPAEGIGAERVEEYWLLYFHEVIYD